MDPAAAPDHYLPQFLLLGLPVLVFMLVMGFVSLRRRWKAAAIILGAVFLLTAGRLMKDARHRQADRDVLIVQGSGMACGVAGLLLILLAARLPRPAPPARGAEG
jgi:hypothetical protein